MKIAEPQCHQLQTEPNRTAIATTQSQAAGMAASSPVDKIVPPLFVIFVFPALSCAWSERLVYTNEPFTFPRENPKYSQLAQGNADDRLGQQRWK